MTDALKFGAALLAVIVVGGLADTKPPPAQSHLAYKLSRSRAVSLRDRETTQERNLAHARYVASYGKGRNARWHRKALPWIRRELAETRRVLYPVYQIPSVWYELAVCESGRRPPAWHINTGNGFYGGLQFLHSTWISAGGLRYAAYPHHAQPWQQVAIAQAWLARTSWSQWPHCSSLLGLR